MLCPLDAMSQLIAMQGDENTEIRRESLRIIQIEDERYSAFLDNRLLEGIELTFQFQLNVMGFISPFETENLNDNSNNENYLKDREKEKNNHQKTSIFGLLYTTCIQSNKKRRNDLLIGLLKRAFQITQIIRNNNNNNNKNNSNNSNNNSNNNDNNNNFEDNNNDNKKIKNNDNSPKFLKNMKTKLNENGPRSPGKAGKDLTVSEAVQLYSLLSFILETISHLPFDFADEPLQVKNVSFYSSIKFYYFSMINILLLL